MCRVCDLEMFFDCPPQDIVGCLPMDVTPEIMRLIGVDPDIGAETVPDTHQPTSVMGLGGWHVSMAQLGQLTRSKTY